MCHVTSVYNSAAAAHARHVQHQDQSAKSDDTTIVITHCTVFKSLVN